MKTSIPPEVWETKRAEIAVLYKEEEWPLKQVIKKIRSDDFNPTETQLRSRLKKWGVTKPSRQRRKKPLNEKNCSPPALNLDHHELRRNSAGSSQLPSLHIPAYFFHDSAWNHRRQSVPTINQPYLHQFAPFTRGDRLGTGMASPSEQLLQTSCTQCPVSPLSHDVSHLPTFRFHGQPSSAGDHVSHADPENGYISHSRSLSSSSIVSPADSLTSIAWPHGNSIGRETRSTISSISPWNYAAPETGRPCSPTGVFLTDSVPLSPNYPNGNKHVLSENSQKYSNYQNLLPSDIEFLESVPSSRTWRRPSNSSDGSTVSGSAAIDHTPIYKRRHEERCHRDAQPTLLDNRSLSDTGSQSPIMIPEFRSSCSDSESHFQDISPVDGTALEYLLRSPHID